MSRSVVRLSEACVSQGGGRTMRPPPGRTCGIWLEVLVERFSRRGEGSLFGIADMEGNYIGDCQSQLLEDEFVRSGGCVGVTVVELGVGLFTPLIGGGKWDDA